MKGIVFCKESYTTENRDSAPAVPTSPDPAASTTTASSICMREKVWGIVPRAGTKNHPLDQGPGQHFSNMMYNARSDTLYEKKTYRDLAIRGNTCVWAVDGFFEWKQPDKNVLSNSNAKQPYYVCRRDGRPLLIPGLWKSVRTGRRRQRPQETSERSSPSYEDVLLDTFTHLTTGACAPLRWLHHRQPVFLWDTQLAIEWIMNPSEGLVDQMASLASGTTEEDSLLTWHPVTKSMSSVKYRNADSIIPIKIKTVPSVKSFFTGGASSTYKRKTTVYQGSKGITKVGNLNREGNHGNGSKRKFINEDVSCIKTSFKKENSEINKKKRSIAHFFAPK